MKAYAASHKHVYVDYYSAMIDDKGMLKERIERRRSPPDGGRLRDHGAARAGGHRQGATLS